MMTVTETTQETRTASTAVTAHTAAMGRALSIPVRGWQVQSSDLAREPGDVISQPEYRPSGWLPAPARSTVMAALLANGEYPGVFRSTTMRDQVDPGRFLVPWWYRTLVTLSAGGRTALRLEGVMHRAELWVNGTKVAGADLLAGAYPVHTIDVTGLIHPGTNAVAVKVLPGHPKTDLSVGWIDWNPAPPDNNMGIWRDVVVRRTGAIRIDDPYVVTDLAPGLDRAELRVGMDLDSGDGAPRSITIHGTILRADRDGATGTQGTDVAQERRFTASITVPAGEKRHVVLTSTDVPELAIDAPAVWWPIGHGEQPLYQVHLTALDGDDLCDQADVTFGIRQVSSTIEPGGGRRYAINGRPVQVLGAGWCPDIFLRHDRQRLADQLGYVVDLGLNTIRLEGKLENPEFFEMADRLGIMVLAGWECCTKWESHAGTGSAAWTDEDYRIAGASMAGEARLLRNHPCVISFLIGSDFAPSPRLADIYLSALRRADWSVPIISSAASRWNNEDATQAGDPGPQPPGVTAGVWPDTTTTAGAGPSGMKMWPYDWVPPRYWYERRFGGAIGFDSECSAGHSIPRLPSLRAMLTPQEIDRLWQQPEAHHFHAAPAAPFDSLQIFHAALAGRYGAVTSLRDFLRKAQLANYEMVRAQFEAYRGRFHDEQPATGVIYWMLNSAWPSLNWHLFDHNLDPAGAYFGAKKANEPLHVQLSYDTGEITLVNGTPADAGPFSVRACVRRIDGTEVASSSHTVTSVPAGGTWSAGSIAPPGGLSPTYFVELTLENEAERVSRNTYWLSTVADELDWDRTTFQYTPQSGYADLTGLQELPVVRLDVDAATTVADQTAEAVTTVTVHNPTATPAVGIHVSMVAADVDGRESPIAPIRWEDNDITLFGGQRVTVTSRYATVGLPRPATVDVEGFNVTSSRVRPRHRSTAPMSRR